MVTIGILSQTHAMFTVFLAACLMLVGANPEIAQVEPAPSTSVEAPTDRAPPAPSPAAPAAPAPAVTKPALTGAASGDPFEGAVEVFHFGFEEEEDRDFDRHPDG